jgi:hypothetical protein
MVMSRGRRLTCRAGLFLLALLALVPALRPGGAAAAVRAAGAAGLSPALAAGALRTGNRVLAYVRFDSGAAAGASSLRAVGAQVVDVSRRYQTVTVAAKPGELPGIADSASVVSVAPVRPPVVAGVGSSGPGTSAITRCFGAATSEGDVQLNAMAAREGFEFDGSDVTVGILSDSFNRDTAAATHAAADVASGDLPGKGNPCGHMTPVQLPDGDPEASGEDEGRAMAQIVHDLAPGASIAFASAFFGELSFAENIKKLAEEGAKVIADDVFYPEEPFFQDGPIAVAVNEVVEKDNVSYFSAAGNNNLIEKGRDIASWEAPKFRDSGTCPEAIVALSEELEEKEGSGKGLNPSHCMNFDPGPGSDETFGITVSKGETLVADLQWAEPRGGVNSDLDAFLLSPGGEPVEESIEDNASVSGTQQPLEVIEWENDTGAAAQVELVINRFSGGEPLLKFALLENGGGVTATEYPESSGADTVGPTVFGHSGATSAITVGAAAFSNSEVPERYSSRGPVTHYFGPVTGPAPAAPIPAEVIAKPDVTATDGGANTFFGSCVAHTWRFFGTSAAAPHAAAVAALALQGEPGATPLEVGQALTAGASAVGEFPPEAVGAGLVDAPEAIAHLMSVPVLSGPQFPQPAPQNCGLPPAPPESNPFLPNPTPTGGPGPGETAPQRPQTFFRQHPGTVIRTHGRSARVVLRFGSDEAGVSFACRIDGGFFRPCPERMVRRFGVGSHAVFVVARDAAGNGDRTPAAFRFKVKQVG